MCWTPAKFVGTFPTSCVFFSFNLIQLGHATT